MNCWVQQYLLVLVYCATLLYIILSYQKYVYVLKEKADPPAYLKKHTLPSPVLMVSLSNHLMIVCSVGERILVGVYLCAHMQLYVIVLFLANSSHAFSTKNYDSIF